MANAPASSSAFASSSRSADVRLAACPALYTRRFGESTAAASPIWPMTGMPAAVRADCFWAMSAPPSILTACAPVSCMSLPALRSVDSAIVPVGHKRQIGHDEVSGAPRRYGAGVIDHVIQRHRQRRVVAEHDIAERIADQNGVHARFLGQPGRRIVVRGHHGDRDSVLFHLQPFRHGKCLHAAWSLPFAAERSAPVRPHFSGKSKKPSGNNAVGPPDDNRKHHGQACFLLSRSLAALSRMRQPG